MVAPRPEIAAIIVAAGRGNRFGGAKHTALLSGKPLWEHSFGLLSSLGFHVIVVGDLPGAVPGGERRRDSVAAGLAGVDTEWVLVHDAARPLATAALASAVVVRLTRGDVDGVVPVVPLTDTVKEVDGDVVIGTPDRSRLVAVQTPQGFRTEVLRSAHRIDVDEDVSDDAGLVERIGGTVVAVPGDPRNLKVTFPDDLLRARLLLGDTDDHG